LTRVDFFDMGTALAAGNIDAFLSGEPLPTVTVERGYGRILAYPYFDEFIGTINAAMLVTRGDLKDKPETVRRLVVAHARATRYLSENPDEWLRKASDFGTEVPVLEKALANIELAWQMDELYVQRARSLGEHMRALGVIQRQPDYDQLFDLSFVRAAAAELARTDPRRQ
jgi:NitT/TauT family transport system substrate-binding protein